MNIVGPKGEIVKFICFEKATDPIWLDHRSCNRPQLDLFSKLINKQGGWNKHGRWNKHGGWDFLEKKTSTLKFLLARLAV